MAETVKILFIGDVIGRPGRGAVKAVLPGFLNRYKPDIVIANGENSAGGFGITPQVYEEMLELGIYVITSGNHIWDKKEIIAYMERAERLIRPLNYPEGAPGKGFILFKTKRGVDIAVLNLCGRVFMETLDCPFRTGLKTVEELRKTTPVIIVDMHAEATSEKSAIAWYLDGLVSAVVGTHTHVQTSDERILPNGTAFITDIGMTGGMDSVIGVEKELVIKRFLTEMPVKFEVAKEGVEFQGVFIKVDSSTGKAISIERIKERVG